ncbi:protein LAS1 isoform X2 [Rosa rugosa]|uniref:protein LAS1 isoform X2 n=1 Tax=Rosa rugosa TaxID=74645 RepID=UPI002B416624|nr:protein LAS1 isoform X2 [Rosa rugosa]
MESLLGFMEEPGDYDQVETTSSSSSSSYSHKLVPWLSWDEWLSVSEALFSNSPDSVASALRRISAWRSRGCVPAVIEVTASIIEIQQKDPHFRKDQSNDAVDNCRADQSSDSSLSEEMLAMLYCMAIMRLVNCVVEKTRKKNEVSIAEAADAIGIPRSLIDIRHEGSHRELPALQVVRSASIKALDWLKYYYWEPQKNAIPFQGTGSANIRNEIKSKFRELASCLRAKMTPHLRSSQVKEKRGYKKDVTKILKSLVGLYSSFSSEVVSVLLELLLNTKSSSDSSDLPVNTQKGLSLPTSLNEWKLVITKFSNKKPELRLALLHAVLDMIETQEGMMGRGLNTSSDCGAKISQVEHLCSLFTWLVRSFKGLKPPEKDSADEVKVSSAEKTISKAVLMDVLRKCLLVSASANSQLMNSALHLAKLTGDDYLVQKLNKLSFLVSSNLDATEENTCLASSNSIFVQQEKSLSQAAKKLELIKRHQMKRKAVKGTRDADVGGSKRWVMAKSWTQCPIGMLPCAVGYSSCLPVLDYNCASEKDPEELGRNEKWEPNSYSGKRQGSSDMQLLDNPCVKKMRETAVDDCVSDKEDVASSEYVNGHLMIGGVWKKVGEEEILAIKSAVRILV